MLRFPRSLACALLLACAATPALAQRAPDASAPKATDAQTKELQSKALPNAAGYPSIPLLSTSTTVLGEKLRYPKGEPHVNASIITLAPGQRTIQHTHGVPLFAYILEGELSVDYGKHGIRVYKKGDSLMETMDVPHHGFNAGAVPVSLLCVYIGAKGAKDVEPVK